MYSIGDFSKINKITTKTLRHYDRIGLLKPAKTDHWTGYRYYSPEQLPAIRKILFFRDLGCSLMNIQEIMEGKARMEDILGQRAQQLQNSIREDQIRLSKVKEYLERLEGGEMTFQEPIIKSIPEVIVASIRTKVPSYDTYFDIVPKMGDLMREVGAVCREPAYSFNIYHDGEYRETNIDVEICEAVVAPCPETGSLRFSSIPGINTAACLMHKGPYTSIHETYNRLYTWIDSNGYTSAGHPRESYIDGIWNKDTPEEWLTEIQAPVTRRRNHE